MKNVFVEKKERIKKALFLGLPFGLVLLFYFPMWYIAVILTREIGTQYRGLVQLAISVIVSAILACVFSCLSIGEITDAKKRKIYTIIVVVGTFLISFLLLMM